MRALIRITKVSARVGFSGQFARFILRALFSFYGWSTKMAVSQRKAKDQAMAQAMKSAHVERRTGRCAICYNMIPNGLFNPSGWDNHLARCPGPKRRYVPKMGSRKVA